MSSQYGRGGGRAATCCETRASSAACVESPARPHGACSMRSQSAETTSIRESAAARTPRSTAAASGGVTRLVAPPRWSAMSAKVSRTSWRCVEEEKSAICSVASTRSAEESRLR